MAAKKIVLINEDDLELFELLRSQLEKIDFEVISSTLSKVARQITLSEKVDLLITDIRLPDMDGLQMAQELVEKGIFVPTVVISGHWTSFADHFLFYEKPFSLEQLNSTLKNHFSVFSDFQFIHMVSRHMNIPIDEIGKVIQFYPDRGWGLINVINLKRPLYVNAADIIPQKEFNQLIFGDIVHFHLQKKSKAGPRAVCVEVKVPANSPLQTVFMKNIES